MEDEGGREDEANGYVSPKKEQTLRLIEVEGSAMEEDGDETLYAALHRLFSSVFFPNPDTSPSKSLFQRLRSSLADNGPSLKRASRNSARKLILWTRRGSILRALFVISVGTIILLALTGLLVFMLFFFAATANAIIISLLMSLAAAGGFLAFFFTCVAGIYIAALSVAVFVISIVTISTIIAVMVATGWIGFFCVLWLAAKKSINVAKCSLSMTGSALSAYSATRHGHHHSSDEVGD